MDAHKINWCKKQKKGIRLVKPDSELATRYLDSAQETLNTLKLIKNNSRMWKATMHYYLIYFCVYSVFIRIGIKSEIHECSILLSRLLEEKDILPKKTTCILQKAKEIRIDNQYYLKDKPIKTNHKHLQNLLFECKLIVRSITKKKIEQIRSHLT